MGRIIKIVATVGGLLLLIAAVLYRRWQTVTRGWHRQYPAAQSYIEYPQLEVLTERMPDGQITIHWTLDADAVMIRAGLTPDHFDREIATITRGKEAVFADPNPLQRTYFQLTLTKNGDVTRTLKTAERIITLKGAFNFRDVGGYPTTDGRTVRWGRLYRSAQLSGATDDDIVYIASLGIKTVCDLRSREEVAERPDRFALENTPNIIALPISDPSNPFVRLSRVLTNWRHIDTLLLNGYAHVLIDRSGFAFSSVMQHLTLPEAYPALIHCTAGKDRAGLTIALTLLAIGVPENIVVQDYSLSNLYYDYFRTVMDDTITPVKRLGIKVDDLRPLMTAAPTIMRGTITHINTKYGSVEAYLAGVGVTAAMIEQLKANLLEQPTNPM